MSERVELDELPADNFGLLVENETDRRKLIWLVNQIGEKKLRISANKRNKYYPNSPLFVSTILKRFNLKVPPPVYAPINVEIFRLYILVLKDRSSLKIGMTGRWPNRAYDFVKTASYSRNFDAELSELWDLELSTAFTCADEADSRLIERQLKDGFETYRVQPPKSICYGCRCRTEWFSYIVYEEAIQLASSNRSKFSLKESLTWKQSVPESLSSM